MIEYDPCSLQVSDDPWEVLKQLRDEAPIYKHPKYVPFFLSRYADVMKALLDLKSWTVTQGTTPMQNLLYPAPAGEEPTPHFYEQMEIELGAVATLDPPVHTRVRKLINGPFKPAAAAELEPFAREIVRGCLARGRERGGLDGVTELAGKLSVRVALKVLGLPLEDADRYSTWINAMFNRGLGNRELPEEAMESSLALHTDLVEKVMHYRKNDTRIGGLGDVILYADFEGRPLNDFEASFHFSMVLIGGTETLPKAASAAMWRLWQHPDQRAELAADPSLVPQAFHEALRYDMPTQMLGRVALREQEFYGQKVAPGECVMFLWPSANRDERQFENADQFDIHRGFPKILSFGQGAHMCLGAHVARMEGRILLEELITAFPEYEVDEGNAKRIRNEMFRGFTNLPLSF